MGSFWSHNSTPLAPEWRHSSGWEADPRSGARDLCEPGLIILAAVFWPLGLGFQKHFKSGRFSSPPDLQRPPGVLVCCTKPHHQNYLSDKVTSHELDVHSPVLHFSSFHHNLLCKESRLNGSRFRPVFHLQSRVVRIMDHFLRHDPSKSGWLFPRHGAASGLRLYVIIPTEHS